MMSEINNPIDESNDSSFMHDRRGTENRFNPRNFNIKNICQSEIAETEPQRVNDGNLINSSHIGENSATINMLEEEKG